MKVLSRYLLMTIGYCAVVGGSSMLSPHQVLAADQPNIMIMGEDADTDTVPRNSRIFNRVKDALSTRMMELGFKVYNETAATMEITNPRRVRRTDAELLSVAQNVTGAPVDVITTFQIYAAAQKSAYSDIKQLKIRISGRMIQVQTGRDLGNYEVSVGPRGLRPLPVRCNADCILEHVGDEAKPVAAEVGAILAQKLAELSPSARKTGAINSTAPANAEAVVLAPMKKVEKGCTGLSSAYTIVLDGFDAADTDQVEAILAAFEGYEHHRTIRSQTLHTEYWYETCSDRARLERNMRSMAQQFPGQNRLALEGNKFKVDHIAGVTNR